MNFEFTKENLELAQNAINKYPSGRQSSAVMELLWIAQYQSGWISKEVIKYIANFLQMPETRVYEVATFYSMYNLKPVGKYFIQTCGTTPCMLTGAEDILQAIQNKLGIKNGETTADGMFSLLEVECLGACANGPMMQINDDYYENLTLQSVENILDSLSSK